jgi:hypothetical protein
MLRHAADAYRFGEAYIEALRLYDRLLADAPDALEPLLGRAECLHGLGGSERLAEAMAIYRRLAASGPDIDERAYWLSQLRMLQILDRVQRNTDQIAPRIERLRLEDPDLGGARYRRAFEQLEARHR